LEGAPPGNVRFIRASSQVERKDDKKIVGMEKKPGEGKERKERTEGFFNAPKKFAGRYVL